VVSPLVALIEDQVKEATEIGITAMQLMSKPIDAHKQTKKKNPYKNP